MLEDVKLALKFQRTKHIDLCSCTESIGFSPVNPHLPGHRIALAPQVVCRYE